MEDKIEFWGPLSVTARTLGDLPEKFQKLYDGGRYRMRPEDIRRMGILLRQIAAANRKVGSTLKLFKEINK